MTERFMGSACLLMGASGMTVEVQSPHKWIKCDGGGISIGLGCIGGGIEEGETPVEALHRESLEEIGCPVVIRSASQTIEVFADGHPRARPWAHGLPRPILVWDAKAAGINADGRGVVYMGTADGTPKPCDLGGLLTLPLDQVFAIGDQPQSVAAVVMGGATLQERVGIPTTALEATVVRRSRSDLPTGCRIGVNRASGLTADGRAVEYTFVIECASGRYLVEKPVFSNGSAIADPLFCSILLSEPCVDAAGKLHLLIRELQNLILRRHGSRGLLQLVEYGLQRASPEFVERYLSRIGRRDLLRNRKEITFPSGPLIPREDSKVNGQVVYVGFLNTYTQTST